MKLYVCGKSSGTLRNFIAGLMQQNKYGWEGNRRFGITLATCHRLMCVCGISTYGLMAEGTEMSTLPMFL